MSLSGFSVKRFIHVPQGGAVKLSTAWNLQSYSAGLLTTCGITFNSDGSLTPIYNDTSDLPDADNWWTDNPETGVGDDYEVAVTSITTGAFNVGAAVGTYVRLDVNRTWSVRVTAKQAPDTNVANGVTFAIRPFGGGSIIDSVTNCNHSASN